MPSPETDAETLLRQAQEALKAGQPADAALRLRQCAGQLVALGRAEEAVSSLDRAIALHADACGHYDRGTVLLHLGRLDPALADFDRALALQPDWISALINRGIALRRLDRPEVALRDFRRAAALAPDCADAFANQVGLLLSLNRPDEALAACEQALKLRPNHPPYLCDLGNALMKLDRFEEAFNVFSGAISLQRGVAAYHANRGQALRALGRLDEALVDFTQACVLDRGNALAHDNRGIALFCLCRYAEALKAFDAALALQPEFVSALAGRGRTLLSLDRPEEAIDCFSRALLHEPRNYEHLCNRATAKLKCNRLEEARADFDKALALAPDNPEIQWNAALMRLAAGDYAGGWPLYEARWRRPPLDKAGERYTGPLWLGGPDLGGKTLLIHAEQGAGDTIQFCRFVPRLRDQGAQVTLMAPSALLPLLATLADGIELISADAPPPARDFRCPLMSLPRALGITLADLPAAVAYLSAEDGKRNLWRERLGARTRPRVGLAWSGASNHADDRNRSLPLSMLTPLCDLPAEFHSLQKEVREGDVAAARTVPLHWHGTELEDFSETAALIAEMDLVVSVDTSVAHLAAALGKPTWILLPFAADWRWMTVRSDTPWYPSARLFRQSVRGDWASVVATLHGQLAEFVAAGAVS